MEIDKEPFMIGDLVWAKMRSCPHWPSMVCKPIKKLKSPPRKRMMCVYFFGTKDYAWVDYEDLHDYEKCKASYTGRSKLQSFKKAENEIEDYIKEKKENAEFTLELPEDKSDSILAVDFDKLKNSSLESEKPIKRKSEKRQSITKVTPSVKRSRISENNDLDTDHSFSFDRPTNHVRSLLDEPSASEIVESPGVDMSDTSDTFKRKNITASNHRFGFIGLGIMGSGIVKNLFYSGHQIYIWNRNSERAEELKSQAENISPGLVHTCATPADVADCSDIIFCCVSDEIAVREIVYGSWGICRKNNTLHGKGYVELSNIDTETSLDIYKLITDNGGRYLEAQLQGSRQEAEDASLIVLCAGDRTLFDDCDTALKAMSKTIFYLGEVGFANKLNLVMQVIRGVTLAGLAEGFALASACGLDLKDVLKVLSTTSLCSQYLASKSEYIIQQDFKNVQQSLRNMQKDMRNALELGDNLNQPLPLSGAANVLYQRARRSGYDSYDSASVYKRCS